MRIFKKILKWLGILLVVVIIVPISIMWGMDKLDAYNAKSDIKALFNELEVGMSIGEAKTIRAKTSTYIDGWHAGDDGTMPKLKGKEIKDTFCIYTPKYLHTFSNGSTHYYAMGNTDLIGFTVNGDKCYEKYNRIKSLFLMSQDGDIIEEKTPNYSKDKDFKELTKAMSKAKKEKKLIILVLFHPSVKQHNKILRKTLESKKVSNILKNNFIYVEYSKRVDFSRTPIGYISVMPVTIFLNGDGEIIGEIQGAVKEGTYSYNSFVDTLQRLANITR